MILGFENGNYGGLKILVVIINLSIFIIWKNDPNIINTVSNIIYILYFCKIIKLLVYYYHSINILTTEKIFV